MKSNELDQLLNGLLAEPPAAKQPAPPPPPPAPKKPVASEAARSRVEEIMRSVEEESSLRKAAQPAKPPVQPLPKRGPVPVPPPISHFTDVPSQNPAVRMRDRLDEISLPMIDAERKPNQIIPPKPKEEPPKKKKRKKKPAEQTRIFNTKQPVPAAEETPELPKRKVVHIEVPDELPPDIPREVPPPVQEVQPEPSREIPTPPKPPKRTFAHIEVPDELPPDVPRELPKAEEPAPAEAPTPKKRKFAHIEVPDELPPDIPRDLSLAEQIRQKRRAVTETPVLPETLPETEVVHLETQQPAAILAEMAEPEVPETVEEVVEEMPKRSLFSVFRRKKAEEAVVEETVETPVEEVAAEAEEIPAAEPEQPITLEEPETPEIPQFPEPTVEESLPAEEPTDAAEVPTETPIPEEPAVKPTRLRHLQMPVEEEPAEKPSLFGFLGRKKKRVLTPEPEELPEASVEEPPTPTPEEIPAPEAFVEATPTPAVEDTMAAAPQAEPDPFFTRHVPFPEMVTEEPEVSENPEIPQETIEPTPEQAPSIDIALPEEEQPKRGFLQALQEALDENAEELAELKAEPMLEQSEIDGAVKKRRIPRRHTYFVVGLCSTLLALCGTAALIWGGVTLVRNFVGGSTLKTELEDTLYPIVVVDIPAFESTAELPAESMLSAAMLDLLMYADLSGYTTNFDVLSIPEADVLARAKQLFGTDLQLEPVTLHAAGETFFYDAAEGCYNVPSHPIIFSYAPRVESMQRIADGEYLVTVAYCSDMAQWQQRSENFQQSAEKMMEITVKKQGDRYQVTRIVNISGDVDLV